MIESKKALDLIAQAFKNAKRPRVARELAPLSIDADDVIRHFLGKSREDIAREFSPSLHMEDFSYMTEMAVEYYLPAVMLYMLRETSDSDAWLYLHSYLSPRHDGELWWNLGGLDSRQLKAVSTWAGCLNTFWTTAPAPYIDPTESAILAGFYAGRKSRK